MLQKKVFLFFLSSLFLPINCFGASFFTGVASLFYKTEQTAPQSAPQALTYDPSKPNAFVFLDERGKASECPVIDRNNCVAITFPKSFGWSKPRILQTSIDPNTGEIFGCLTRSGKPFRLDNVKKTEHDFLKGFLPSPKLYKDGEELVGSQTNGTDRIPLLYATESSLFKEQPAFKSINGIPLPEDCVLVDTDKHPFFQPGETVTLYNTKTKKTTLYTFNGTSFAEFDSKAQKSTRNPWDSDSPERKKIDEEIDAWIARRFN